MKAFAMLQGLSLYGVLLFASIVASISPISIKGAKLYDQDGKQFFIKGVIYMGSGEVDVLINSNQCQLDAGLMKSLGVNTIRVYGADSTKNHDACMQAFANQGIYVWLDLATPSKKIEPKSPAWTIELYNNWTSTVDSFAGYDNLLSFTIGEDTMDNTTHGSVAAISLKSAARDIRAFSKARGYRPIPISFASATDEPHLSLSGQYLACGNLNNTIDIMGINNFNYCSNSTYSTSGLDRIYESFQEYNIPLVFTETGCINQGLQKRDFSDVQAMLGPVFQNKFSGAIVYEWAEQMNLYGLVQYSDEAQTGFPSLYDDYSTLATIYSTLNPTGTPMSDYKPTETAPACPTSNIASAWAINGDAILPTIDGLDIGTVTARTTMLSSTNSVVPTGTGTTSDGSNSEGEQNSGLSRGGLIGVIVGCIIAALLLIGLAVFFFFRKRNSLQERHGSEKIELPAEYVEQRQELDVTSQSFDACKDSLRIEGTATSVKTPNAYEMADTSTDRSLDKSYMNI